jgi:hypothetical protein
LLLLLLLSSGVRLDTQIVLSIVNKLGGQGGSRVNIMQRDNGELMVKNSGFQSMVHNSDSKASSNQGGFHKSDMQGQGREARLFTQEGDKGFFVSHSLLYSSSVVTKLLDNPLAPSTRVLASAGKQGANEKSLTMLRLQRGMQDLVVAVLHKLGSRGGSTGSSKHEVADRSPENKDMEPGGNLVLLLLLFVSDSKLGHGGCHT